MANQEKIDKKLESIEGKYVDLKLKDKMSDKIEEKMVDKYAKVLLKTQLTDEEAKALATLKRKKLGLRFAEGGAAALGVLGYATIVLLPFAVPAAIGAGIGAAFGHAALGAISGATLAGAGGMATFLAAAASRKVENWMDDIGYKAAEVLDTISGIGKTIDAMSDIEYDMAQIVDPIKKQALDKLRTAAEQARQAQAQETATEPEA